MSEGGRGRQKGAQTHRHRHTATPPSSLSFFRLRLSGSQRMSCGHCFKIGLTTMVASLSFPTPCLWTGCRTNCPKRTSTPCSATKVVVLCCAVLCCAVLRFVLLCCVIVCTCVCVALRPARLTHVTAVELTGGVFRDMMDLKLSKFDTANPDGKLALKINKLCVCISTSCFAPPPHPHTCVHSLSCCPFSLPLRLFDGTKQRTKVNRILPQVHRCVITYDCVCV